MRKALSTPVWMPLVAFVLLLALALAGIQAYAFAPIVRDALIAMLADWRAGEAVPIGVPKSESQIFQIYGATTNAPLMARWAYEIVPFFAIENVSNGHPYPSFILLAPFVAQRSFVVAGSAHCEDASVYLNDRFLDDQAQLLGSLTHELIHTQNGNFCAAPAGFEGDRSVWIESHTTAATLEVMAAMCRYGNPIACQGFWQELSRLPRRSVQAKLGRMGLSWIYDLWANVTLRNDTEDAKAEKMVRFWNGHEAELQGIVERYGELPWETMVLPGICGGRLDTGNLRMIDQERAYFRVLGMAFDDTWTMLGWLPAGLLCAVR